MAWAQTSWWVHLFIPPSRPALVSLCVFDTTYPFAMPLQTPHYLTIKTTPFFRGREMLDPADFPEFLHPFTPSSLQVTSDSALAYHPETWHIPGYPANPRMLLSRLYLQMGVILDYYTGKHTPSLSASLRESLDAAATEEEDAAALTARKRRLIPERHHAIFPQFGVTSAWPPTFLCHGESDSAVPVYESRHMHALLVDAGVPVQLRVVKGKEHSFDYEANAESLHGSTEFDLVLEFLKTWLGRAGVKEST